MKFLKTSLTFLIAFQVEDFLWGNRKSNLYRDKNGEQIIRDNLTVESHSLKVRASGQHQTPETKKTKLNRLQS